MRPSRNCKLLLKLTLVLCALSLGLYCLRAPNVLTDVSSLLFDDAHNASSQKVNSTTTLAPEDVVARNGSLIAGDGMRKKEEVYNVWCIFTKVTSNSPMRRKFRMFVDSLLRYSTTGVVFHVITDEESKIIAEKVIEYNFLVTKKKMKVTLL